MVKNPALSQFWPPRATCWGGSGVCHCVVLERGTLSQGIRAWRLSCRLVFGRWRRDRGRRSSRMGATNPLSPM